MNIAVAWGIACWSTAGKSIALDIPLVEVASFWGRYSPTEWEFDSESASAWTGFGIVIRKVAQDAVEPRGAHADRSSGYIADWLVTEMEVGWPMRCARVGWWERVDRMNLTHEMGVSDGWSLVDQTAPRGLLGRGIIPYSPLAAGFLANTAFNALILWLLILGPLALRRLVRRRRGRCIKCGYDLRGDFESGCPECGWNRPAEVTE